MAKKDGRQKKVYLTTLKSRGWTDSLIKELLPEPEIRRNPHYRSAPSSKLWKMDDVIRGEKKTKFIRHKEKLKAAQKKKEEKRKEAKLLHEKLIDEWTSDIATQNPSEDYIKARSIRRHFIINVGPTNSGKTYTAIEALKKSKSGVYLAPLRLLAMEIADKLNDDGFPCSMITGEEEAIIEEASFVSCTVEMMSLSDEYEVGIIDECQMLADKFRGGSWTRAIFGLLAKTIYLCMSPDAVEICKLLIEMCGDTYEINEYERNTPLIFMSKSTKLGEVSSGDAIIAFSRREVLEYSELLTKHGYNVAAIYGALPYESRKKQVEMFRNHEYDIVVATDAIGMGLNLPIKRVLFTTDKKFDGVNKRSLNTSEIKQISGRAGRRGIYDKGYVGTINLYSGYYYNSYKGASLSYIKNTGEADYELLNYAIIPFPSILLDKTENVSTTINNWIEIKYASMFKHEDYEEVLILVRYLEKKYSNVLSKKEIFRLSTVPFSVTIDQLRLDWEKYVDYYINKKPIVTAFFGKYYSLEQAELYYKRLSLAFAFCRMMGFPIDKDNHELDKSEVIKFINECLGKMISKKISKEKNNKK